MQARSFLHMRCTTGVTSQKIKATGEVMCSWPRLTYDFSAKEEEEYYCKWLQCEINVKNYNINLNLKLLN